MNAWDDGSREIQAEAERDARAFEEANRDDQDEELDPEQFWDRYAAPIQRTIDFTKPPTELNQ